MTDLLPQSPRPATAYLGVAYSAMAPLASTKPLQARQMRVAYGRVSSTKQADIGALERQEQRLLAEAQADLVLLDVGSGKTTARPNYQRLLALIEQGEVEQVLVADQDRLNRNLAADLQLWQLCSTYGTRITDLHGREIEFRTPDGELLSTMVSALNQHRSKAYGQKTKRGLEEKRRAGLPAVASVPFGIRKVFDGPRLITLEVDPETRHLAKERIEKFLEIGSINGTVNWINQNHPPDCKVEVSGLRRWLIHPYLTGRLCHSRNRKTEEFDFVATEPSFEALISDTQAERVAALVARRRTTKALAGRKARAFTGLCRCADCGTASIYKQNRNGRLYMKCANAKCDYAHKYIREELVQVAISLAMPVAAEAAVKTLVRPKQDPPRVKALLSEIDKLESLGISGLEDAIAQKKKEVAELRAKKANNTAEALALALTHPKIWIQPEDWLNRYLFSIIDCIHIKYQESSQEARVCSIRFKPEIECSTFEWVDVTAEKQNGFYMFMLMAQQWAVDARFKGWSWDDLEEGYLPAMRQQLPSLNGFLEDGGAWPEINAFADQGRGFLHGRLSQLSKLEPRLNQLWNELIG